MNEPLTVPKIGYLSWMDLLTENRSLTKLSIVLLGYILIWYVVSSAPLWISGQLHLINHYIWPLGAGGIFLSFITYAYVKPLLDKHIENIDLIVSENHKNDYRHNIENILKSQLEQKYTYLISISGLAIFFVLIVITWTQNSSMTIFDFLGIEWFGKTDGQYLRITSLSLAVLPVILILVTGLRLMYALLQVIRVVDLVDFIPLLVLVSEK